MRYKVDVTIIGAGIIGLSIAAAIGKKGKTIILLEKNLSFGEETSSRNSEVLHAGIYYPCNSLKAITCVRGNRRLYKICEKNGIFCRKTGKLIVAEKKEEIEKLEALLKRGKENGVEGLKILTKNQISKIEPEIRAEAALFSSWSGIVDSHGLMQYFLLQSKSKGVDVLFKTEVIGIERHPDGYEVRIIDSDGRHFAFKSEIVINSGGLESDKIAQMVGIDIKKQDYILKYCKGSYFRVTKKLKTTHLIYPLPSKVSLGIHLVIDKNGRIRLGPDAEYIERNQPKDYSVDPSKRAQFYKASKSFLPCLKEEDLIPDTSGIRPKLQGPTEDFRDFVIKEESDLGFEGFINLIGIDSPGLTSCVEIAKIVKKMVGF